MGFGIDCIHRRRRLGVIVLLYVLYSLMAITVSTKVLLVGENLTLTYDDIAAYFGRHIHSASICGKLYTAKPLDACSSLATEVDSGDISPFVLMVRGGCSFHEKVRRAQKAGFHAAIVYDNEDHDGLIAMTGDAADINIPAVFVSKASGEELKKYAGMDSMKLWLISIDANSEWWMEAITFISMVVFAVLFKCLCARRRESPRECVREFRGMSSHLVKAMPSLIFTAVLDDKSTSSACAVCLEDYNVGDKLRILPCQHKFHAICIDAWLTSWRTFCPICKRDAKTSTGEPPASECTPLISSSSAISMLSSSRSFRSSSSSIQLDPSFSQYHRTSSNQSVSSSPQIQHILPTYRHSPSISIGQRLYHHQSPSMSADQSYPDLGDVSSLRSPPAAHLMSPHSMGYPSSSPSNTRYMHPYIHSPGIRSPASHFTSPHSVGYPSYSPLDTRCVHSYNRGPSHASSYLGSSSWQLNPSSLHYSESMSCFSPYTSAHSLPGC